MKKIKLANSGNGRTPNPELSERMMLILIEKNIKCFNNKTGKKVWLSLYQCNCGNLVTTRDSAVKTGVVTRCFSCGKNAAVQKVKEKRSLSIIEEFKAVHGDRYDYSKVIFDKMKSKVEIICKEHGSFYMAPSSHLRQKQNCPTCAQNLRSIKLRKFNTSRPATLYYVFFEKLGIYKLGVTTQIKHRFNGEVEKPTMLFSKVYSTEQEAYFVESLLLKQYFVLVIPKYNLLLRGGNTEVLSKDILQTLLESVETIENTNEFKTLGSE
jgi:hypothetical protein